MGFLSMNQKTVHLSMAFLSLNWRSIYFMFLNRKNHIVIRSCNHLSATVVALLPGHTTVLKCSVNGNHGLCLNVSLSSAVFRVTDTAGITVVLVAGCVYGYVW